MSDICIWMRKKNVFVCCLWWYLLIGPNLFTSDLLWQEMLIESSKSHRNNQVSFTSTKCNVAFVKHLWKITESRKQASGDRDTDGHVARLRNLDVRKPAPRRLLLPLSAFGPHAGTTHSSTAAMTTAVSLDYRLITCHCAAAVSSFFISFLCKSLVREEFCICSSLFLWKPPPDFPARVTRKQNN